MNHIFYAGEHLLAIYSESGEHPRPPELKNSPLVDITNWAFDIMPVNETNCMVFADPGAMKAFGSGFTFGDQLIADALVWRDRYLYRHNERNELVQVGEFPTGWHNLSRAFYVNTHENGELYDEAMAMVTRADNVNETKEYQDLFVARMMRLFLKYNLPARFGYCINVNTGNMSRVNVQRMKELEEQARAKKN